MSFDFGYLYIRYHFAYDIHDTCKLGSTENIVQRDATYATGEYHRGFFYLVIEVDLDKMRLLEKMMHRYFKSIGMWMNSNGGTEFYKKDIVELIIPYLQNTSVKFKVLSKTEISKLIRIIKIKDNFNNH